MSSLALKRLCVKSLRNLSIEIHLFARLLSSCSESHFQNSTSAAHNQSVSAFDYETSAPKNSRMYSYENVRIPFGSTFARSLSSQAAVEASSTEGLTVEGIVANNWVIYDENESDWKSHASAIAQSIHLIKKRLRVRL